MYRLIHSIALLSALLAVAAGLWQDWGLLTVLKRVVLSYLGFFVLGSLMVLGMRTAALLEGDEEGFDGSGKKATPAQAGRAASRAGQAE